MPEGLIQKVIRSKRKTLALQVARDATLIIRAPERASMGFIEKFVERSLPWIEEKQRLAREASAAAVSKQFTPGEEFFYLGERYPLVLSEDVSAPPILFDGREFQILPEFLENARNEFTAWYRRQALEVLSERVAFYREGTGLKPLHVKINDAKTRWGSCNSRGGLNFSWRLIMAPLKVIDYVAVHELVHTAELNHSRKFWSRVESIMPEYREAKSWLRQNEHLLEL